MADPRVDSRPNIDIDPQTIELIEKVVYDEAGGESPEGRDAVRAVIYNRIATNRRDFGGNTALGVLNARKQFQGVMEKGRGDARNLKLPEDAREKQLKEHVAFLERGVDPTNGATFFQNPQIARNAYKADGGQRIGRHVFYDNYAGNRVNVPDFKVSLRGVNLSTPPKPPEQEENPLIELLEEPQSPFQGMASTTPQVEEENPLVALEEPEPTQNTPFSPLQGRQQAVPELTAMSSPMDDTPKFAKGGMLMNKNTKEKDLPEDEEGNSTYKEIKMAKNKMYSGGLMEDDELDDDDVDFESRQYDDEEDEDEESNELSLKKPKGMSSKDYDRMLRMMKVDSSSGSSIGSAIANAGKLAATYIMQKNAGGGEVAKAFPIDMYKGGMMAPDIEVGYEEESGNPIPPGSLPEEVADDVPVFMSVGEVVLPADVVRWHGLKHIMQMRSEAKAGLMCMYEEGQIQVSGEDSEKEDEDSEEEGEEIEDKKQLKVLEDIVGDEELIILFRKDGSIFKS